MVYLNLKVIIRGTLPIYLVNEGSQQALLNTRTDI